MEVKGIYRWWSWNDWSARKRMLRGRSVCGWSYWHGRVTRRRRSRCRSGQRVASASAGCGVTTSVDWPAWTTVAERILEIRCLSSKKRPYANASRAAPPRRMKSVRCAVRTFGEFWPRNSASCDPWPASINGSTGGASLTCGPGPVTAVPIPRCRPSSGGNCPRGWRPLRPSIGANRCVSIFKMNRDLVSRAPPPMSGAEGFATDGDSTNGIRLPLGARGGVSPNRTCRRIAQSQAQRRHREYIFGTVLPNFGLARPRRDDLGWSRLSHQSPTPRA